MASAADDVATLEDLVAVDGIADHLVTVADAPLAAALAACSRGLRETFGAELLWASLLARQEGGGARGAATPMHPRRAFAQRAICARWSLPLPTADAADPTTGAGAGAGASVISRMRPLGSPPPAYKPKALWRTPLVDKENAPPAVRTATPPALRAPPPGGGGSGGGGCAVARLREGLRMLMMGAHGARVSACPEAAGDWSAWSATITCPDDGSPLSGETLRLRLGFELDGAAVDHGGLPTVAVLNRPLPSGAAFHPNVDAGGTVCARALARRCAPAALVGDVLLATLDLLRRPVFAVPPSNAEAAAGWYD